jgi:hypothetical protein
MKRMLPALCAILLLTTLGPAPAEAWWWPWHRHSGPGPAGVGANAKDKQTKAHRESRVHEKVEALYHLPKSFGWHRDTPGPMGAGSGEGGKNQTPKQQSAERSSNHKSLLWWHHHDSTPPAAAPASGE